MRAAVCAGGALFFDDLLTRLRLLPNELETALSELAGQGLAACDGFAGLRTLCARAGTGRRRTREVRAAQMAAAGRWSLTGMPRASAALPSAETGTGGGGTGAQFSASSNTSASLANHHASRPPPGDRHSLGRTLTRPRAVHLLRADPCPSMSSTSD